MKTSYVTHTVCGTPYIFKNLILPSSELTTSGFPSPLGFKKLILKPVPIMRPICVFGCSDNPVNKHATLSNGNFSQQDHIQKNVVINSWVVDNISDGKFCEANFIQWMLEQFRNIFTLKLIYRINSTEHKIGVILAIYRWVIDSNITAEIVGLIRRK